MNFKEPGYEYKIQVEKSMNSFSTNVYIVRYSLDGNKCEILINGKFEKAYTAEVIPASFVFPYTSNVVVQGEELKDTSNLEQKEKDKNFHISNLNDIIKMLIKV